MDKTLSISYQSYREIKSLSSIVKDNMINMIG